MSYKFLSFSICLIGILFSCNNPEYYEYESVLSNEYQLAKSEIREGQVDNQLNNTFTPYDISLMQKDLMEYNASHGISDSTRLSPTHLAIVIHTNNMQTLHEIEADSTLISFPFAFGQSLKVLSSIDNDKATAIMNYDECGEIVDNYSVNTSASISVLWPVGRTIPLNLSYDYYYDAFVPASYLNSSEGEVSSIIASWIMSGSSSRYALPSRLTSYDNRLEEDFPLKNVPVYMYHSSQVVMTQTDANGYFTIPANMNYDSTILYCTLTDQSSSTFSVRDSVSNNIITEYLGSICNSYHNSVPAQFKIPRSFETDIYQAAWYYFHGSNDELDSLTLYNTTGNAIDIYAINTGSYLGCFYYYTSPTSNLPRISIYKNNRMSSSQIFGTVLHELGHASHYACINSPSTYYDITPFIKESFASFTGWYNVKSFYSSVAPTDETVNSICSQGRQTWKNTSPFNLNYTPIFIDLFDTYNQYLYDSSLVIDTISSVPVNAIVNLATSSQSFNQLYGNLCSSQYYGVYYSGSQLSQLIQQYFIFQNTKGHEKE